MASRDCEEFIAALQPHGCAVFADLPRPVEKRTLPIAAATWPGVRAVMGKEMIHAVVRDPDLAGVADKTALMRRCLTSPDFREGIQAFKDKRAPKFGRWKLTLKDV